MIYLFNDNMIAWCKSPYFIIYKNKTRIVPTTAIITNNIFTDFKYFLVSGLIFIFKNMRLAPKDITMKKRNTKYEYCY